jgi:hypothetical protein
MRLFRRGRTSRAAATVLWVHHTERLDQVCQVEVHPPLAAPFQSELRTHRHVAEAAETFVLYDPEHPEECELDLERLRASGVDDDRAYTCVLGETPLAARGHVTLADAARRLSALDHLSERRRDGQLTYGEFEAERRRILGR